MRVVRCGLAALALAPAAGACGGGMVIDRHPDAGGVDADPWGGGFHATFNQDVSRNVDILFLIDNSSEVRLQQNKLRRDFPTFVSTLQSLPGGMPNVHIAVVSSDMGAGDGSISGCAATTSTSYSGNNGIFQYAGNIIPPATTPCTTNLQPGATFISNVGGVANYTGALTDVFGCIASLGESGCGFEHHFAAILRALGADDAPAPAENAGFLRVDADLAIVMLANEDDCSVPPGVRLFDTIANKTLASQLGPPANFRCNEFGHLCRNDASDFAHPGRLAPNNDVNATVAYSECMSNDAEGFLLSTRDVAVRLKAVKSHPPRVVTSRILMASIQGPATPYVVRWTPPYLMDTSCGASSCPWPMMAHSCTSSDTSFADPGVRTQQLVGQFGADGLVLSSCDDSYASGLQQIGAAIGHLFDPQCIGGSIKDDSTKPGLQPDCRVTGHVGSSDAAADTRVDVPPCADTGGVGPCWTPTRQQPACNGGASLQFTPDPRAPSAIYVLSIDCPICTSGVDNPTECY